MRGHIEQTQKGETCGSETPSPRARDQMSLTAHTLSMTPRKNKIPSQGSKEGAAKTKISHTSILQKNGLPAHLANLV